MDENRKITDDLSDIKTKELAEALPNYFIPSPDIRRNAYLNWRFETGREIENQFFDMARAYFETAIKLIDCCLEDNRDKKADIWIFPILFNVVHGIEVYLKGFNSLYRAHMKLREGEVPPKSNISGNHDISQLCSEANSLLRQSANKELLDEMTFVSKFIEYLYKEFDWTDPKDKINDKMTFARYPILKSGKAHFYVKKAGNVTVNLDTLRQWVLRLHDVLYNVNWFIDFEVDRMKEAMIENALITQEWEAEMAYYYGDY